MDTDNLYVNQKKVIDLELKRHYAKVLLKGNATYIPVPFDALVWRSPDWYRLGAR